MGRPRKWESDAERKRASRAGPVPSPEPEPPQRLDRRIPTEEEYLGVEVLATKLAISRGLKDHDGQRVARARAYARFRYRGFLAGEVASL